MNAIELLEALLRGPAGGPPADQAPQSAEPRRPAPRGAETRGADILRDILGGGAMEPAAPAPSPRPAPTGGDLSSGPAADDGEKADLKELLRQAKEREAAAADGRPYRPSPTPQTRRPEPVRAEAEPAPAPTRPPATRLPDEEATILIRAMINATRADGRLDREEEQKILRHLGQPSPEMIAFIQAEFQKPLDVKEFAWSVPLGLEQKAYALSLAVLELDQREESAYLKDLAHGLRLPPEVCADIHRQLGAPILS